MKCACIDAGDYDYPEFHHSKTVKARKPTKCHECRRPIEPGEKYDLSVDKWDGEFSKHNTCMDCRSIGDTLFCSYYYGGMIDSLYEDLTYNDVPWSKIAELTPRAREMVLGLIERIWEDRDDHWGEDDD